MDAVRESDYLVGQVLKTISASAESREHTMVVLTADHGAAPWAVATGGATQF